jgi:hypothetical protein
MTNKPRAKGTAHESAAVNYLKLWFPHAHRQPLASPLGDVGGLPVTAECKDCQKTEMPKWWKQVVKSSTLTGLPPFIIHKRRNAGIKDSWVTTNLETIIPFWEAWAEKHLTDQ